MKKELPLHPMLHSHTPCVQTPWCVQLCGHVILQDDPKMITQMAIELAHSRVDAQPIANALSSEKWKNARNEIELCTHQSIAFDKCTRHLRIYRVHILQHKGGPVEKKKNISKCFVTTNKQISFFVKKKVVGFRQLYQQTFTEQSSPFQ
jgi:hypothetical protein